MKTRWETVERDDTAYHRRLSRRPVPGGWIYKSHDTGVCFVPTPACCSNCQTTTPSEGVMEAME